MQANRRVTDSRWVYDRGALLMQSAAGSGDQKIVKAWAQRAWRAASVSTARRACRACACAVSRAQRWRTLSHSCEIVCRGLIEVCHKRALPTFVRGTIQA